MSESEARARSPTLGRRGMASCKIIIRAVNHRSGSAITNWWIYSVVETRERERGGKWERERDREADDALYEIAKPWLRFRSRLGLITFVGIIPAGTYSRTLSPCHVFPISFNSFYFIYILIFRFCSWVDLFSSLFLTCLIIYFSKPTSVRRCDCWLTLYSLQLCFKSTQLFAEKITMI